MSALQSRGMGVKAIIRAVVPAGARQVHAAEFHPGSSGGHQLCNPGRLVMVPLARIALERVTCQACNRIIDHYPEGSYNE